MIACFEMLSADFAGARSPIHLHNFHGRLAWQRLGVALALTAAQIAMAMAVAGIGPPERRQFPNERPLPTTPNAYDKLCSGDCFWYAMIAEHGYRTTVPPDPQAHYSNVAFFPAFPLTIRGVHWITSLSWSASAILASQFVTAGFWWALLAFLEIWRIPRRIAPFVVMALFVHPASLYMVEGYSESLFMFAIVGVLCCCEVFPMAAGIFGALLSATRIVGLPLMIYPAMKAARASGKLRAALIFSTLVAPLGGLAFFVFCWMRFGIWDLYLQTQRIGWGHVPDYLFFLRASTYHWSTAFRKPVVVSTVILITLAVLEIVVSRRRETGADEIGRASTRRALLVAGLVLFYFEAAGTAIGGAGIAAFSDFSRYSFPIVLFAALVAGDLWRIAGIPGKVERVAAGVLIAVCCLSLIFLNLTREAIQHFR
jgi:hypothetical protein